MAKFAMYALASLIPVAAWAQQTVILRDGTQFSGRMTEVSGDTISFRDVNGGNHRIDSRDIDSVRFETRGRNYGNNSDRRDNGGFTPDNNRQVGNNNGGFNGNNSDRRDNGGFNDNNNGNQGGNGSLILPAGTQIAVRTNENVSSRDSNQGRSYAAQVDQDVMDANGNLAIPRGSSAQLVVRRLNDNSLALDLQSVTANGQRFNVNTADIVQGGNGRQGLGENKRTAEYVGGTAVLGTLLGALAGGGKGAAIGALAGGAAGAGAEVLTRGGQVSVPAETVLNFRLDNAISLNPVRY